MTNSWSHIFQAGEKWSGTIAKGKLIRFTAMEARANVSIVMYNAKDLTERYNMPDTLKAQHTYCLKKGNILMSDNGRAMTSIVEDDLGWHDPLGGYTTRGMTDIKYGKTSYQTESNGYLKSGKENLEIELVRNGLQVRDLAPILNLFSKIAVDDAGNMQFEENHCRQGDTVTLRTEMDVLVILSNTPNPHDPRKVYPAVPVKMEVLPAEPLGTNDHCVKSCLQNERAFENTWAYYTLNA